MLLLSWTQGIAAQPHVHVRGKAIVHASTFIEADGLRIAGQVTDEGGAPLSDRSIALQVDSNGNAQRATTRSNDNGAFEQRFPALGVQQTVHVAATIEATAHIDGVETTLAVVRGTDAFEARIVQPADRRIDLDEPRSTIEVSALGEPVQAHRVEVRNENDVLLGAGLLGRDQPLVLSVDAAKLGPQGYGRLVVQARSDATTTQMLAAVDVLRFRTSHVMATHAGTQTDGLRGTITSKDGQPLAQQAIAVLANDARVATVLSDRDGTFVLPPNWRPPITGSMRIVAVHESGTPWWIGGRSAPIDFSPASRSQPPWWPIGALAIASVLWLTWRQRRARKAALNARATADHDNPPPRAPDEAAISGATSIHGTLIDSITREPIRSALMEIVDLGRRVATDTWGRFHMIDLPSGSHTLLIQAEGYEETRVPLALPHAGHWHHTVLRVRSLRTIALTHYRRGIPTLPGVDDATQIHTSQELLALNERGTSDALRAILRRLTHAFEIAYYAGPVPSARLMDQVQRSADEAEQERNARIV